MKDWEELLIKIYYLVCDYYQSELQYYSQRYSNNSQWQQLAFTDEEALTVYLFGILEDKGNIKQIYRYTNNHLLSWFPNLSTYQKFNERLNRLAPCLQRLVHILMEQLRLPDWLIGHQQRIDTVVDSMPIILAKGNRSDDAKVARQIANKGYCSSKDLYYHGIKLHSLGVCTPNKLPKPLQFHISKASANDNTIFKQQIAPLYSNIRVYGDKIYHDQKAKDLLWKLFGIEVVACNKRKKGQKHLTSAQKFYNTLVSRIRQPIESFFNWLDQHSKIQDASKTRSTKGVLKHIFGRLAAALILLIF